MSTVHNHPQEHPEGAIITSVHTTPMNELNELDAAFDAAIEERASFYHVTVDYYLEEFFCSENLDETRTQVS